MAIKHLGNQRYRGLSTDSKPTNVPIGVEFEEEDTGAKFYWNGSSWTLYTPTGGQSTFGLASYIIYQDPNDNLYKALHTKTGLPISTTSSTDIGVIITWILDNNSPAGTPLLIGLAPGVLNMTTEVVITPTHVGNIHIKGAGAGVTTLHIQSSMTSSSRPSIGVLGAPATGSADLTLTANATKGSQILTMSSGNAATLSAGDYVIIRSLKGWNTVVDTDSQPVPQGEIQRVLSVSASTVTLDSYLYDTYNTVDTAVARKLSLPNNITFSDFTYEHDAAFSGTSNRYAVFCFLAANVIYRNLEIKNTKNTYWRAALCMRSVLNGVMDNCRGTMDPSVTWNKQYAMGFSSCCQNCVCNCCVVSGPWRHGVEMATASSGYVANEEGVCRNCVVSNCVVEGATTAHYDTHNEGEHNMFVNCMAISSRPQAADSVNCEGFKIRARDTSVIGCYVYGSVGQGIRIAAGEAPNCQIENCTIKGVNTATDGTNGNGIQLDLNTTVNLINTKISGNTIKDCAKHGILLLGQNHGTQIENNAIIDCCTAAANPAILVKTRSNPSTGLKITGNMITGANHSVPLTVEAGSTATDYVIVANHFKGNASNTPSLASGATTNWIVKDNVGYNPVGTITNPFGSGSITNNSNTSASPTSTTVYTNRWTPKTFIVTGGTVSRIFIDGVNTGQTSGVYKLGIGETIAITFTVAPTVTVRGD